MSRLIDADELIKNGYVLTRNFQQDEKTRVIEYKKIEDVPTCGRMGLIDADKLIELIDDDIASLDKNMSREGYDVCLCTLRMVKQYIKALQRDATNTEQFENCGTKHGEYVKIVRCKDCAYAVDIDEEGVYCSVNDNGFRLDDFCSLGEPIGEVE
jgi:hypothetical protein